jgi:hypothetical protein
MMGSIGLEVLLEEISILDGCKREANNDQNCGRAQPGTDLGGQNGEAFRVSAVPSHPLLDQMRAVVVNERTGFCN